MGSRGAISAVAQLALPVGFQYNTATGRSPVHHVCREADKT